MCVCVCENHRDKLIKLEREYLRPNQFLFLFNFKIIINRTHI